MTGSDDRLDRALLALRRAKAKLDANERTRSEPIAIVGMACRFPGGIDSAASFGDALEQGLDAIAPRPSDRPATDGQWPLTAGAEYGGYLADVDRFDAAFFGISPREASAMDPQQRIAMEVAWHALEDAGVNVEHLEDSDASVFLGISSQDYRNLVCGRPSEQTDTYDTTGTGPAFAAGRLSYFFGARGPSVAVDTACSSSLVATHLACKSLRDGETSLALVGGVNLIISAVTMRQLVRLDAMSPTGRCRPFDAAADGMVRGEGCGFIVLRRLSDALERGDHIWATIRGSAVNQDGASAGLTAPNVAAQRDLLRTAHTNARVGTEDIGCIETHGTGTRLGDPVEFEALREAFGPAPSQSSAPIRLGAVKASIGHLEAAAGIAGLIKAALAIHRGRLFGQPNFETSNPLLDLVGGRFEVPIETTDWPSLGAGRIAGVSSFGLSGTNAHVVLGEGPRREAASAVDASIDSRSKVLTLSARSPRALGDLARRYAEEIARDPSRTGPLCRAANLGRSRLQHRAFAVGTTNSLQAQLTLLANRMRAYHSDDGSRSPPKIALVFGGLIPPTTDAINHLRGWPAFRATYDAMLPAAHSDAAHALLTQLALHDLLASIGVRPDVVAGIGAGEFAAAVAAMRLSRAGLAQHMSSLTNGPTVHRIALRGDPAVVRSVVERSQSARQVARMGPGAVLLEGPVEDIDLLHRSAAGLVRTNRFDTGHSLQFPTVASIRPAHPQPVPHPDLPANATPFIDGAGHRHDGTLDPNQFDQLGARAVDLPRIVEAIRNANCDVVIEVGTSSNIAATGRVIEPGPVWLHCLDTHQPVDASLGSALAQLYALGAPIDWRTYHRETEPERVTLPLYPFDRQRHWLAESNSVRDDSLLGQPHENADGAIVFDGCWDVRKLPFLANHRVHDALVAPAALFVSAALAAAQDRYGLLSCVEDLTIERPLAITDGASVDVQFIVRPLSATHSAFDTYARIERGPRDHTWQRFASATLTAGSVPPMPFDEGSISARCPRIASLDEYRRRVVALDVRLGAEYASLQSLSLGTNESLGRLDPSSATLPAPSSTGLAGIDVPWFDAVFQALAASFVLEQGHPQLYLPVSIARCAVYAAAPDGATVWAQRTTKAPDDGSVSGDLQVQSKRGEPVATFEGLRFVKAGRTAEPTTATLVSRWTALPDSPPNIEPGPWLVVSRDDLIATDLIEALRTRGVEAARTDCDQLAAALAGRRFRGVIDVTALASSWKDDFETQAALLLFPITEVARHAAAQPNLRLLVVTEGARHVSVGASEGGSPQNAMLWGAARCLSLEQPGIATTLIDVEGGEQDPIPAILDALARPADETALARRAGVTFGERLGHAETRRTPSPPSAASFRLSSRDPGDLSTLHFTPVDRSPPARGQVEIEVAATGMNFRDVLIALGMDAATTPGLGFELAGRVVRVGAGVDHVRLDDEVLGLASDAFGRFVTADARRFVRAPTDRTAPEAATLGVAFCTAWYALHDVARLAPGESILIHSAAGGVGMAAVQVALEIGAVVYGTASEAKWPAVRALGVSEVMDSRTSDFADAVMARTDGRGVDVVLNSLTGPFIQRSFECLAPNGRFVEIGKTDIWDAVRIAAVHATAHYTAFDLAAVDPDRLQSILHSVVDRIETGQFAPLPARVFPLARVNDAFRWMARAQHVGKVVVTIAPTSSDEGVAEAWLVTGGTGALGRHIARWLVERRRVRRLIVVSRTPPNEAAQHDLASLIELDASIEYRTLDIGDRDAVNALFSSLSTPIAGLVHAAGVVEDGMLQSRTSDEIKRAVRGKAAGAWNLHRATIDRPDLRFVMISSAAGALGHAGQGLYAAANAYLDELAHERRDCGLHAVSIAWGPWRTQGMSTALDTQQRERLRSQGLGEWTASRALARFDEVIDGTIGHRIELSLDRPNGLQTLASTRAAVLRGFRATDLRTESSTQPTTGPAPAVCATAIAGTARREVARVLGLPSEHDVEGERPFKELGMDSLMTVELTHALSSALGRPIVASTLYDHPTLDALIAHLGDAQPSPPLAIQIATSRDAPIAIVGVGCRFPGGMSSPELFWDGLMAGRDSIIEVPPDRWDADAIYDADPAAVGKTYARWGGFIDSVDQFDAAFFKIAPREAATMDPQQRILLEVAFEALENAGQAPDALEGTPTGVFVGICTSDYSRWSIHSGDAQAIDIHSGTGNAASVAAGRLSYVLGATGPAVSVDTACSSSLVGVHLACQSLRDRECDLAIAGGVSLILAPDITIYFSRLGAMASDGHCHTFDASADGYVRSDGCGAVVLKRLDDAIAADDRIIAVIAASAVNQDGRSNGLTAPNGRAQQAVINRALQRAGVRPEDVDYVEAHGTATALGDPIEMHAIGATVGRTDRATPLIVGSVKPNIGHTEGAAGIAGLIKTALAIERGVIPPNIHFETPSPHIDWHSMSTLVPTTPTPWPKVTQRTAGVSSFGFSGTNAHVILQQVDRADAPRGDPRTVLIPISARSERALFDVAQSLADALEREPSTPLQDVARTLALGRTHDLFRAAAVVDSTVALQSALRSCAINTANPALSWGTGRSAANRTVFVFAGQGSQWTRMGADLAADSPAYAGALREVERAVQLEANFSVIETIDVLDDAPIERLQPAIFATQIALTAHLRSSGIVPDASDRHQHGRSRGRLRFRGAVTGRRMCGDLPAISFAPVVGRTRRDGARRIVARIV